ncbi:nucleoside hydrolase [Streptomyces sp. NPDC004752]
MDVDTGIDDAMAIMFAVRHPDIELHAISCVAGNTHVHQVVDNTLRVLDLVEAPQIPVAAGATRPLIEPARPAEWVHGEGGLGGLHLPPTSRAAESVHSVELIRQTLLAAENPLTIVATAPLTNVALLLRTYPELSDRIERIVIMGGSASIGNATAVAEFNVWHDPEAAFIVFSSGLPLVMYGLDVFDWIRVDATRIDELTSSEDPIGRALGSLLGHEFIDEATSTPVQYGVIGDAGTLCALVAPHLYSFESLPVRVDLSPGIGRGQTQVDRRSTYDPDHIPWPKASIALESDPDAVLALFFATLLGQPSASRRSQSSNTR